MNIRVVGIRLMSDQDIKEGIELGKRVREYSDAVAEFGIGSEEALAVRKKHADLFGFTSLACTVDNVFKGKSR